MVKKNITIKMRPQHEIEKELVTLKMVHLKMTEDIEKRIYSDPRSDQSVLFISKTIVQHQIQMLEWVLNLR